MLLCQKKWVKFHNFIIKNWSDSIFQSLLGTNLFVFTIRNWKFINRLSFIYAQANVLTLNHYIVLFQDEVADLKSSKDVSHSTLEDLDTEDLYVKFKVSNKIEWIFSSQNMNFHITSISFNFVCHHNKM